MKISLIGYMGVGKTTIGKELSKKLQIQFLDLDTVIESEEKCSISEIFNSKGEIGFRKVERELLISVLEKNRDFVLALGGGTPAYYDNITEITENSKTYYLRMPPAKLLERLDKDETHRPLINRIPLEDRLEFVAKHLFDRRSFYDQAHETIDVADKTISEIVEEIIQRLHR